MNKLILAIMLFLLVLALAAPILAQISPHFDLGWSVLTGGGGPRSSGHYQIDDVLGQWPDGLSTSEQFQIDPGFWHTGREGQTTALYLPVTLKGVP